MAKNPIGERSSKPGKSGPSRLVSRYGGKLEYLAILYKRLQVVTQTQNAHSNLNHDLACNFVRSEE
jgi:hypothetical protein